MPKYIVQSTINLINNSIRHNILSKTLIIITLLTHYSHYYKRDVLTLKYLIFRLLYGLYTFL